jgi:hypothetical protein
MRRYSGPAVGKDLFEAEQHHALRFGLALATALLDQQQKGGPRDW